MFDNKFGLFTNYASQCQGQRRDKKGQAGTSRDKAGTNRDRQGQTRTSLSVPACPYLFLSAHACPCLSLSVLVCPCLSLSVAVCPRLSPSVPAILLCVPLQMNIIVFINMNIVTFTFLAKATVPMCANLLFTFLFTFHLASSITQFNLHSSILVFFWCNLGIK